MKTMVLVRLASVNAIGFSASTIMPLWIGVVAAHFEMPAWFASLAIIAQLGGAAGLNLATPILFASWRLLRLARLALLVAAAAYLAMITAQPAIFILGCLVCGSALGVVLNVTNRLMGSAEHVQRGYATFVLIEVCFATALFLICGTLIARYGLSAVFPIVSAVCLVGFLLLHRLAIDAAMPAKLRSASSLPTSKRGFLALAGFGLFFIGQASLNAFMPTIGQAMNLDSETASRVIGLGMPFGFVGAILARIVGERVRPVPVVLVLATVIAATAITLCSLLTFPIFIAAIISLSISTIFVVPYFFAQLGSLDRSGRFAAWGPAMMLAGIATGPSIAVVLNDRFGLATVGAFAATLLLLGATGFAISALPRRQPKASRPRQLPRSAID